MSVGLWFAGEGFCEEILSMKKDLESNDVSVGFKNHYDHYLGNVLQIWYQIYGIYPINRYCADLVLYSLYEFSRRCVSHE